MTQFGIAQMLELVMTQPRYSVGPIAHSVEQRTFKPWVDAVKILLKTIF